MHQIGDLNFIKGVQNVLYLEHDYFYCITFLSFPVSPYFFRYPSSTSVYSLVFLLKLLGTYMGPGICPVNSRYNWRALWYGYIVSFISFTWIYSAFFLPNYITHTKIYILAYIHNIKISSVFLGTNTIKTHERCENAFKWQEIFLQKL